VHNLTIGNLTVRADPSIRTAAIESRIGSLSKLEVYVHKAGAQNAIATIKRHATTAPVHDRAQAA
jgi:uncharacterized protein YegP (UPF0339 family)